MQFIPQLIEKLIILVEDFHFDLNPSVYCASN